MKASLKPFWARCGVATGLFLFGACGDVEPLTGRISPELSPECALEIALAVDFWSLETGIDSPIDLRVSNALGPPKHREIVFVAYAPDTNKLGHTDYEYTPGAETIRATIFLRDSACKMRGVAHEIGYAFQLKHRNTNGKLQERENKSICFNS